MVARVREKDGGISDDDFAESVYTYNRRRFNDETPRGHDLSHTLMEEGWRGLGSVETEAPEAKAEEEQ